MSITRITHQQRDARCGENTRQWCEQPKLDYTESRDVASSSHFSEQEVEAFLAFDVSHTIGLRCASGGVDVKPWMAKQTCKGMSHHRNFEPRVVRGLPARVGAVHIRRVRVFILQLIDTRRRKLNRPRIKPSAQVLKQAVCPLPCVAFCFKFRRWPLADLQMSRSHTRCHGQL